MASVLALTTLAGCAGSGPVPFNDSAIDLPPVNADLKVCFQRQVPPPPEGKTSKRELFALISALKRSADDKDRCGARLVCWYEDVARGLMLAGQRGAQDPACVEQPTK